MYKNPCFVRINLLLFVRTLFRFSMSKLQEKTKLTLKVKKSVIDRAKRLAKMQGVSVSHMVENYFSSLSEIGERNEYSPITKVLTGVLKIKKKNVKDEYTEYLIEKYS
jgi:hypothetical protein